MALERGGGGGGGGLWGLFTHWTDRIPFHDLRFFGKIYPWPIDDLYGLNRVAGREPCDLRSRTHVLYVGSVLCRSCMTRRNDKFTI